MTIDFDGWTNENIFNLIQKSREEERKRILEIIKNKFYDVDVIDWDRYIENLKQEIENSEGIK